jgi:hypothetical protein
MHVDYFINLKVLEDLFISCKKPSLSGCIKGGGGAQESPMLTYLEPLFVAQSTLLRMEEAQSAAVV